MLENQIRSCRLLRSSLAVLGGNLVDAILSISGKRGIWFVPVRELCRADAEKCVR